MRRLGRDLRQRQPSAQKTIAQKVAAILRKYGTDAHVYLPGIGVINGLTAGNYLDSVGTTAATVDNPVGKVDDAAGAIDATQATTSNKPVLRSSGGLYSWQFADITDYLTIADGLYSAAGYFAIGCSPNFTGVNRTLLGSKTANGGVIIKFRDSNAIWLRLGDGTNIEQIISANSVFTNNEKMVVSGEWTGTAYSLRKNSVQLQTGVQTISPSGKSGLIGNESSLNEGFVGSIYPVIIINGTVTSADKLTLERFVASLSGVTI